MKAGLVELCGLRDPTDGRLRAAASFSAARGRSWGGLEEAANRLAGDAEADDLAGRVDVGDRVGRNEAAVAGEDACANGECVGDVGERSVHRTLDFPDDSA